MKREIKFRGNSVNPFDNWVYGYLVKQTDRVTEKETYSIINDSQRIIVVPESIGQYTGLKDKNGIEIYEGDIVQGYESGKKLGIDTIVFEHGEFKLKSTLGKLIEWTYLLSNKSLEVIGNIYENPDLIEK